MVLWEKGFPSGCLVAGLVSPMAAQMEGDRLVVPIGGLIVRITEEAYGSLPVQRPEVSLERLNNIMFTATVG
jgi:hypothetical protein